MLKEKFVTAKNAELWEKLSRKYTIEIKPNTVEGYMISVRSNHAIIYVDPINICEASFTHELLHLDLDYHEFYLCAAIKRNMTSDPLFVTMFNANMTEPLCNFIEHKMIFKHYSKLGLPDDLFIVDYFDKKINQNEIDSLIKNYKIDRKINVKAAHFFIGKLASLFGDVNDRHDYNEIYLTFKSIDSDLYDAVANLFAESINHDYENADYIYNYRDIAYDFHKRLLSWKNTNQFI
ncbi:hypothetical protein A4C53_RS16515 [Elizabethkingia anophelis]|uniref:hypothetical protein n=1 Tax=Elizabethkingia anophelis TaxID=1117645 RepID=UPI00077E69F9|nr:hypothetical protein [Elizabethkingia anophelis]AMR42392.1 hypothetical protein A2T74_14000 [Elizabethkingia anophelis]AMX49031.1 hypothetical protein A4C56_14000 [Elizabethkingia anophelis]AMX52490.1 hypothetical protein A2T72_14000 [Elizabethkingia anophelis]AMX55880.1 hypothetical protein A2T59_14000 [Elizabethkingia anophelis]EGT4348693.1 hypothetical protein [Elizabethkingia anophelis]